jgi:hypothetical protein
VCVLKGDEWNMVGMGLQRMPNQNSTIRKYFYSEVWVLLKWWSICTGYIPVSAVWYSYSTCTDCIYFIWLIWDDEYGKNILTVKKYFKIFYFFFIIFQLYISLFMKIVETMDKKSKFLKYNDNNSFKK